MKKIITIGTVGCAVVFIDAQLRIRPQNPTWRAEELACCVDRRHAIVPYGASGAVEAIDAYVKRLLISMIAAFTWLKKCSRAGKKIDVYIVN